MSSPSFILAAAAVVFPAAAFLIFVVIRQLKAGKKGRTRVSSLPPGPRPWPVVGNLVDLALVLLRGDVGSGRSASKKRQQMPLHAALASLSRANGPLMHLQLGSQHVVVASSADAAREALRFQDRSIAGRPMPSAYRVPKYADYSMVWSEDDGPRWRRLRGVCRSDLLGAARLEVHEGAREQKAWEMVRFLLQVANSGGQVRVADMAFRAVLDMFGWMVMSRDDMAGGFQEGCRGAVDWDLKKDFARALELGEAPNLEDFFPTVFGGWDLQGIRKEVAQGINRIYAGFGKIVNQRKEPKRQKQQLEEEGRTRPCGQQSIPNDDDFLDILLRRGVDGTQLDALLLDLFAAGIDTTTSCIEWTMAELVKNPHVMARLRHEINSAMGGLAISSSISQTSPPQLREAQLLCLPYLQACIKESLRLHPPAPLLLPHRAKEPCELAGYHIPEGAVVLVNVWAIGRDPTNWGADALVFNPDRFLDVIAAGGADRLKDFKGSDFEFIPFGSGRRACPGMALGTRLVQLVVASMVYYFDWELPGGGSREQAVAQLSMEEKQGLVLDRKEPLILVPKPVGGLS